MPGVKGRALLIAVAAVTAAGSLDGCGGKRPVPEDVGSAGAAGTAAPMGSAGTIGAAAGTQGGAGTSGPTGAAGTAGPMGAAGTSGDFGQPTCRDRVSNQSECAPTDLQFCYKPCGPERQGGQALMCSNGLYYQAAFCAFDPNKDYSCYAIPKTADAACPAGVAPMAAQPCNVPHCTLCNSLQGVSGGYFYDSAGAAKNGYCVCQPPNANGTRTWSCASDVMWPCPTGVGCGPV
jgi:hypothetical protein